MKLNRVVLNGGVRVHDELQYVCCNNDNDDNGGGGDVQALRVRVVFIGSGSRLVLELVGDGYGIRHQQHLPQPQQHGIRRDRRLYTTKGGEYFQNPREIVEALRSLEREVLGGSAAAADGDGNRNRERERDPKTHWVALVLFRGGERLGTLSEVRERLRLEGRRGLEE